MEMEIQLQLVGFIKTSQFNNNPQSKFASLCTLAEAPPEVQKARFTDTLYGVIIDRPYYGSDAEGQHAYRPIFRSVPFRGGIMHPTKWLTLEHPESILVGTVSTSWTKLNCRQINADEIAQLDAQSAIVIKM